jgi:uncharacterized membrane protein YhaH (DUF805 family)
MNFVDSVKCALKNHINFRGRASRSEFWYFIIFDFSVLFLFGFIHKFIYKNSDELDF